MIIAVRHHEGMVRPDDNWTIEDAAAILDPELTAVQVRAMVELFKLRPNGSRLTGRRGRPLPTYEPTALQEAHAFVMRARVDLDVFRAA